jgi:hypothetical protein
LGTKGQHWQCIDHEHKITSSGPQTRPWSSRLSHYHQGFLQTNTSPLPTGLFSACLIQSVVRNHYFPYQYDNAYLRKTNRGPGIRNQRNCPWEFPVSFCY